MSNIHTLTSTQSQANVRPNKNESKKGLGFPNIHTLDEIIHDGGENPPEMEEMFKAYQVINMMQEELEEVKIEAVGWKHVAEERSKRIADDGQYIDELHNKIDILELTQKKAGAIRENLNPTLESYLRDRGKQMNDTTLDRIKKEFATRNRDPPAKRRPR